MKIFAPLTSLCLHNTCFLIQGITAGQLRLKPLRVKGAVLTHHITKESSSHLCPQVTVLENYHFAIFYLET